MQGGVQACRRRCAVQGAPMWDASFKQSKMKAARRQRAGSRWRAGRSPSGAAQVLQQVGWLQLGQLQQRAQVTRAGHDGIARQV